MAKKQFHIPKNFSAQYELIEGVKLKDFLFFIPSTILMLPIIFLIPIGALYKIIICAFLVFIPFCLVFIQPIDGRDIKVWQILKGKYDFMKRQKVFYYRKEGWNIESVQKKSKINNRRKR
ncbi:hypothetical protein OCO53_25560 [Peribacillus frigoritolerans]|uniref:hypothetical protein n=1 Tax=Peribacillus frigoritolerans TaxID=450367 RepID=UPI0021CFDBA9|nr:hypothetical protein [Peribacillus frigoritolerans]MCU6603811.1 hypothetical protein [Peribacillus frigoritolerans]